MRLACRSFAVALILVATGDRPIAAAASSSVVVEWSTIARRAVVPAGPGGVFGSENFGNKFPGEAAVYMGIIHAAMYDTAVAIYGGYQPYAVAATPRGAVSVDVAIATTAHHVIVGLQPSLGLNAAQQAIVDNAYAADLAQIADGPAKSNGIELGEEVAAASLALRANDGREKNPQLFDLSPPAPGPGVWSPGGAPAVGLRMPGIRPIVLQSASQFRPDGPNALTSAEYAADFDQVKSLGRFDSATRTPEQTAAALFWPDHDLRQWNDAILRLAADHGLDLMQTSPTNKERTSAARSATT